MAIATAPEIHATVQISRSRVEESAVLLRAFAKIMKSENVIFDDIVGYQRNGVSDEFYRCFRPTT